MAHQFANCRKNLRYGSILRIYPPFKLEQFLCKIRVGSGKLPKSHKYANDFDIDSNGLRAS